MIIIDCSYPSWWLDISWDELETQEDCLELERLLSAPIAEMTRLQVIEHNESRAAACESARNARKRAERMRNAMKVKAEAESKNTVIKLLERIAIALERLQP